jgi:hypothetical protein
MNSKIHELKTWVGQFRDVKYGKKRFEIRLNDRDYHVGDRLYLCEYDHETHQYTGDWFWVTVEFVMVEFPCKGVTDGFAVMSIRPSEWWEVPK